MLHGVGSVGEHVYVVGLGTPLGASFFSFTVNLGPKEFNSNHLPAIRKTRVGKHAVHNFTQRKFVSAFRIGRKQTYLSLEIRARVVVEGPSFQMFQEDPSLLFLDPKPI